MSHFRIFLVLACVLFYASSVYGGVYRPRKNLNSCSRPCNRKYYDGCDRPRRSYSYSKSVSTEVTSIVIPGSFVHTKHSSSTEYEESYDYRRKCGHNEEYTHTVYGDATCFDKPHKACKPYWACRCKPGYVRHNGRCIKRCKCPCKDPNAEWVYTSEGRKTCNGQEANLCKPVWECRCRKGYVYHKGKCICKCDCPCDD